MSEAEFRRYLLREGRSARAADRCIGHLAEFSAWIGSDPALATSRQLQEFVGHIERTGSAKSHLWALAYFFDFVGHRELATQARRLRSQRMAPKRTALAEFIGLPSELLAALAAQGISNTDQLLAVANSPQALRSLLGHAGIAPDGLDDAVAMARFTQIRGVAAIRARLYRDCVGTLERLAGLQPDQLIAACEHHLHERGVDWIPPTPKEAEFTVAEARRIARSQ